MKYIYIYIQRRRLVLSSKLEAIWKPIGKRLEKWITEINKKEGKRLSLSADEEEKLLAYFGHKNNWFSSRISDQIQNQLCISFRFSLRFHTGTTNYLVVHTSVTDMEMCHTIITITVFSGILLLLDEWMNDCLTDGLFIVNF